MKQVVSLEHSRSVPLDVKAVLFDFADTLVHTERFDYDICLGKMVQKLGKNGIPVLFEDFRKGYFESRDRYYKETENTLEEQDFGERIRETLKACGIKLNVDYERLQEAAEAFCGCFVKSLTIDSFLPRLLEQLRGEYRLAVVSNMSFAEAVFQGLRRFRIANYFDAIVVSGVLGWRKPAPRIFREALRALSVEAERAVFVGDSPIADVQGAKQLGMKTVLVVEKGRKEPSTDTFRIYVREGKSNAKPDKTISKLAELPEALHDLSEQTVRSPQPANDQEQDKAHVIRGLGVSKMHQWHSY
jgi:putative hydrolase of the HAD superfamily